MKVMSRFTLIWFLFLFVCGCAASNQSRDIVRWENVTAGQLSLEVEESRPDEIWNYAGSDSSHHYFYREPGSISIFNRQRIYRKVHKDEVQVIPRDKQVPFDGKAVSRSFAFTQMANDRSGFTHSLSRGLVDNVLKPLP